MIRRKGAARAAHKRSSNKRVAVAGVAIEALLLILPTAAYATIWISPHPGQPKQWYLLRLLLPVMCLIAVVSGIQSWRSMSLAIRLMMAGQALVASASLMWAANPDVDNTRAVAQALGAFTGLLTLIVVKGYRSRFRALCMGFVLSAILVFGVAAAEMRMGRHLESLAGREWRFGGALGSTFANPNNFAAHSATLLSVLAVAALRRRWWILGVPGLGLASVLVLMTGSRTAFMAILAATIVSLHLGSRGRWTVTLPKLLIASGIVFALVAIFDMSTDYSVSRYLADSTADGAASDDVRTALTQAGLRAVVDSAGIGWGPGIFEQHLSSSMMTTDGTTNMHNAFLEIAVSYGVVPALLILAALLAGFIATVRQGSTRPRVQGVFLGAATGTVLSSFAASSILSDPAWWLTMSLATLAADQVIVNIAGTSGRWR